MTVTMAAVLGILATFASAFAADEPTDAWQALAAGGHVALIRHGNAPGPSLGQGDPPGFKLNDCATQRNLDDAGRAQSRALGEAFRQHNVRVDKIEASPWCRCMETAELMGVGPVARSSALVPIVERNPNAPALLRALGETIAAWRGPGTLVLVTHGFTIRAVTGFAAGEAETFVLKPTPGEGNGSRVIGRIPTPK